MGLCNVIITIYSDYVHVTRWSFGGLPNPEICKHVSNNETYHLGKTLCHSLNIQTYLLKVFLSLPLSRKSCNGLCYKIILIIDHNNNFDHIKCFRTCDFIKNFEEKESITFQTYDSEDPR
jgi:hypothetical protein